ncbi:NUDIX hydrolase [Candidatus Saccharibacteria bacterium]|nr:MAG: NUDIX hydrolase [Candidatus Saccharibacteria bacterium]
MDVRALYSKYIETFPDETAELRRLAEQARDLDADLTSRKNFVGHVTASAFVVHAPTGQVLLLKHAALGKMLQPGGHIEPTDRSLSAAVLREVEEETGLAANDLRLYPLLDDEPEVPFDIDSHYIPANDKKGEPEHYHHDFRLLYTTESLDIATDPDESDGFVWMELAQLAEEVAFAGACRKITDLLR